MPDDTRRILIVDDEKNLRESLAEFLLLDGFSCSLAASGEEGLAALGNEVFDAVVLDLRLPGIDGLEVLRLVGEGGSGIPVLMVSAHGEIRDAVTAMKLGAVDYLVKPFDPAELAFRLEKAVAESRLLRLAAVGQRLSLVRSGEAGWLGDDPAMQTVAELVRRVAPSRSTVLVTGESGTGKEVVAREIHRMSPRAAGPFVPVNVGALPESLVESELFGHEKGSFTGAESRRVGLFELASGGTLFLDEIGEMPPSMQVKLLRVLQDRTVVRVGGTRPVPVDVRIVAATNRDLEAAVRSGSFREDLYFRLNVIRIRLPALRERPLDIPPLAALFAERFAREMGKQVKGISGDALSLLSGYPFPGNVRELENAVERAVILARGEILTPGDFALEGAPAGRSAPASDAGTVCEPAGSPALSVREAEKRAVIAALERNGGHRERTASELGISRRTLLTKMKEYGLVE